MRTERPTYRPMQMMPFGDIDNPFNADLYEKANNDVGGVWDDDAFQARDEVVDQEVLRGG